MKVLKIAVMTSFLAYSGASFSGDFKTDASALAKAGGVAASMKELAAGPVASAVIEDKFGPFGADVLAAAKKWAADPELRESVPAFRRFLFFDYLTANTQTVAAATNPDQLLINTDASVSAIFDNAKVAASLKAIVEGGGDQPVFQEVDGFNVAAIPMKPTGDKAKSCMSCHASPEVGKPYPEGSTVLGWTVIAQPK